MRKKVIKTDGMSMDEKEKLRKQLKEEYEYKLHLAEENLPGLKERLKARGYTLTDDYKVYKIVDGVAVWLSPVATLNVINGKPEVTQQDKNRMVWSLRKEGKLKTPFFERTEVRALVILCFIVVGFPFMAYGIFGVSKVFIGIAKGEYDSHYQGYRERAIKEGESFFDPATRFSNRFDNVYPKPVDVDDDILIPVNETKEERAVRYKNQRTKEREEYYNSTHWDFWKDAIFYLKPTKRSLISPKAAFFSILTIGQFAKIQIFYFFNWLHVMILTTDFGYYMDERYELASIQNDMQLALLIPFVMGPMAAAFLYPVTIVLAGIFIMLFLPSQLMDETCMTEEEIDSARTVLSILAAKSVFDSAEELKRRKNNPVKFDE